MNKYPVIFLSLKKCGRAGFPSAYQQLVYEISSLYREHEYLLDSPVLSTQDKFFFHQIRNRKGKNGYPALYSVSFPAARQTL